MIMFDIFSERLKRLDILQLAIALFAVLIGTIIFTWPISVEKANNSYFAVSLVRVSFLALSAFFYGTYGADKARQKLRIDLMALIFLAIVTIPIEIASYALSLPQATIFWPILLTILDIFAFFGLGFILSQILDFLRVKLLASMFILGSFFGLFWLDIRMGEAIFSPISAVPKLTYLHIVAMLVLASYTIWKLRKQAPVESKHD